MDCNGRMVQRAIGTIDYHKCIVCRKGWVNERFAGRRVQHSTTILQHYPKPEDWQGVRFSDEIHLVEVLKEQYVLFESLDNSTAMIVF